MYPNPTNGEVTIDFNRLMDIIKVSAISVTGGKVFEQIYYANKTDYV